MLENVYWSTNFSTFLSLRVRYAGGSKTKMCEAIHTVDLTSTKPEHGSRAVRARGFENFLYACSSRGFDTLPSNSGRCPLSFSAGSSKIKIRTSSPYKAKLALYGDEVPILILEPANGSKQRFLYLAIIYNYLFRFLMNL